MIYVSIQRAELIRLGAYHEIVEWFDCVATMQSPGDPSCIVIEQWTPLHSMWAIVAGLGMELRWLEDHHLIPRANFAGVDLRGADLRNVHLDGEHLVGADLRGADLREATLYGANVGDAQIDGANLCGAFLGSCVRRPSLRAEGLREDRHGYLRPINESVDQADDYRDCA